MNRFSRSRTLLAVLATFIFLLSAPRHGWAQG